MPVFIPNLRKPLHGCACMLLVLRSNSRLAEINNLVLQMLALRVSKLLIEYVINFNS